MCTTLCKPNFSDTKGVTLPFKDRSTRKHLSNMNGNPDITDVRKDKVQSRGSTDSRQAKNLEERVLLECGGAVEIAQWSRHWPQNLRT